MEPKKKKNMAFMSSFIQSEDEKENLDLGQKDQEEEIVLMAKRIFNIYKKKRRIQVQDVNIDALEPIDCNGIETTYLNIFNKYNISTSLSIQFNIYLLHTHTYNVR